MHHCGTLHRMTTRIQAAERELLAAINDSDLVDDLPADEANSHEGRRARYRAGVAIKAAEVNALLAIADALNSILLDLADDQAAAIERERAAGHDVAACLLPDCQCLDKVPHPPHDWASLSHRWCCEGVAS